MILRSPTHRLIAMAALFAVAFAMSCGPDATGPSRGGARYARGLSFQPVFPALASQAADAGLVPFTTVHIVLHRLDGTIALDTVINFPPDATELTLSFDVALAASAPPGGEPLTLNLAYINAAGETVFEGGPFPIVAVPSVAGAPPPPPVSIPVSYTGPGSTATSVVITPHAQSVFAGDGFAFTAQAFDASGDVMPGTPIVFSSSNPALAPLTSPSGGSGVAAAGRGAVTITAQLLTGPSDAATLTVQPQPSAITLVSGSGQTAQVGTTLPLPAVVRVTATDGLGVSGVTVAFTPSGDGTAVPASAVTNADGLAQTAWSLGSAAASQTLEASAAGLAGSPVTFTANATPKPPAKLVVTTQPVNALVGVSLGNVTIAVQDASNNVATTFSGPVSIAVGANPGSATLAGTTTVNAVAGIAVFSTLSLNVVASGYTLVASSDGLTSATTAPFDITSGPATRVEFTTQPASAVAGIGLAPVRVTVRDLSGNVVTSYTGPVQVSISANPGGATLSGATTVSAVAGVATFSNLSLNKSGIGYTLLAGGTGFGGEESAPFSITAAAPAACAVTSGDNQTAPVGATLSIGISVTDAFGNGVPSAGVTAAVASGGGSLASGSASTDLTGLALFAWTLGPAVGPQSLSVTCVGVASGTTVNATATSAVAGPATQLAFTVQPPNAAAGVAIAPAITVTAQDVANLTATSFTGNVTLAFGANPGASVLSGTVTVAAVAGVATFTNISLNQPSTGYTLVASSGALTPATSSVFNITSGAGAVASTVVTPPLDTLTALTATFGLTAQARDASNNPVAGTFTWVSRAPAVATVSPAGLVTAVANGSTWVVATETGGTKDSALIVVQQRIATINVSPGTRAIYLTRNFTFTAAAVDGLGNPVAGATSFVWSSTAPAIATVDTGGRVSALGLGGTQIRATSGAITGVANVTVLTPITRIAVVRDTAGASVSDVFTLTALGITRSYRAIAHDTLDAVMTGVTFAWASTNGSVAIIDSTGSETARALSAANGITSITATAQGITGAASLTVQQVLTSVVITPAAASVAPLGSVGLTARGQDSNNQFIAGGTFTWTASNGFATVNASGIVTGVSVGTDSIVATSGAIASAPAIITVTNAVPPVISFGRDTLSLGRGSSSSVPVFLSRPNGTPVTINLAVADTVAYWSTASVTIPAGQTSVNATLNGRNAGMTTISASDGSGTGYASDTAVLAVTATMRLTSGGYAINATDQVATQVLLSDPSPAGGTYVTFTYSTPGVAAISPDPAFIPAGQLAADIQIRGLAAGSTSITPTAIGVNGTPSSFTAYAPVLTLSTTFTRLGRGQFAPNHYVYTPTYQNFAVPVTFTSSDTNIVTVSPSVTSIPGGNNYVYYAVSAKGLGTATITVSSPGWTAANSMTVVSTTPAVGICCGGTLFNTAPAQGVTVYAEDSVGTAHYRTNSLAVRLSSTDTTVMKVLDTLVTIGPAQYYNNSGRVIPNGSGGTAYIVATASGHRPDSTLYTVVGPPLAFNWGTSRIGAGQEDYNRYVYTPNNVLTPLVVTIANPDSTKVGVPASVTIPAGTNYVYFTVRGKAPGTVTLTATATGYAAATATYIVTTPRLVMSGGSTINNFGPPRSYIVYATDSVGTAHYRSTALSISLSSNNTGVITTDTVATIGAGQYYTNAILTPVGIGTARILATATGHGADSATYTIVQPKLNFSFTSYRIGRRQHRGPADFYVYTPDSRPVPVVVTITQTQPAVDSLTTTTPTIPANNNYSYFSFYGNTQGVDTLIATATGYAPDTAIVRVTSTRLVSSGLAGSTTTTNPPIGLTVYATDSVGTAHYVSDTVVVRAVSSDTTVIRPTQPYFRIVKDAYYFSPSVTIVGPGVASMTYSDSAGTGYAPTTTGTITVTGPSLALSNGTPVLGMRQTGGPTGAYVYTPNSVATPLVVNLVSTSTRVVTVPATVTIPAGSSYAYFAVTAADTLGTIQVQASATGYNATSMNVQVTQPKFVIGTSGQVNTTSPKQGVTVYAADANGTAHYVTENVTVTLASSSPSVATFDSTTVTILSGNYYHNTATWSPGIGGTAQLSATDARAVFYKYSTGTANISVVMPTLNFSFGNYTLGIGQYLNNEYVYTPDNQLAASTVSLSHTGTARTSTLVGGSPVSSVTIPASTNYVYFRLLGTSAGTDTLVATLASPAHNPATAYTIVGQGRVDPLGGWPGSLNAGDSVLVTLYARDPATNARYVQAATTFTLAPNARIQFVSGGAGSAVITSVTIPADQYYVQFYLKGVSAGTGSVTITATNYVTYTTTVTIQ